MGNILIFLAVKLQCVAWILKKACFEDSVIDQKITLDSDSSVALALSSQMKVLPVDRVTCILCQESQDIAISVS